MQHDIRSYGMCLCLTSWKKKLDNANLTASGTSERSQVSIPNLTRVDEVILSHSAVVLRQDQQPQRYRRTRKSDLC